MDIPYFFHAALPEGDGLGNCSVEVSAPQHEAAAPTLAAERVTAEGAPVRHLSSFLVSSDQTGLDLFESSSADAVARAAALAELDVERVVEAIS